MFWNSGKKKNNESTDPFAARFEKYHSTKSSQESEQKISPAEQRRNDADATYSRIAESMLGEDTNHEGSSASINRGLGTSSNQDHAFQGKRSQAASTTSAQPRLNRGLGDSPNRDRFSQAAAQSQGPSASPETRLNRGFGSSPNSPRPASSDGPQSTGSSRDPAFKLSRGFR